MVSLLRNAEWVLAVGVIGIAATAVAGVLIWRRVRRIRLRVRGGQVAGRLYGRMLRILARRGFTRLPGTTPAEFAERVSRDWAQAASPVNHLTHLFCRTRYGQEPMSPLMLRQAESWLTELQGLKS
jgi:hypothetical protein